MVELVRFPQQINLIETKNSDLGEKLFRNTKFPKNGQKIKNSDFYQGKNFNFLYKKNNLAKYAMQETAPQAFLWIGLKNSNLGV